MRTICFIVLAAALAMVAPAQAQYDLNWRTIDGGGVTFATGGNYSLGSTIGQPDAGTLTGGGWQLNGGFWQGGSALTPVEEEQPDVVAPPLAFRMYPSAPNPFNPTTRIAFDLPAAEFVALEIYNLRGERVRTLQSGELASGNHVFVWNGTDDGGASVASGTYLLRLRAGAREENQKLQLVK
jgi:hypothetical protein